MTAGHSSKVPMRVSVALARRRGERRWREPEVRERARAIMDVVTRGTVSGPELDRLARAHVVEGVVRREFHWHPTALDRQTIRDGHHLERALATGRGVLLSACHTGPNLGFSELARRHGRTAFIVAGGALTNKRRTAEAERWQRQLRFLIERGGSSPIPAAGSFDRLAELLRAGELVVVLFDAAGRTPTEFLGRTLDLTSGTARLADAADALIVPLLRRREGHRLVSILGPVHDPREAGGILDLHAALAQQHDAWIAADPAAYMPPSWLLKAVGLSRGQWSRRDPEERSLVTP